jgi:hypothetical protein
MDQAVKIIKPAGMSRHWLFAWAGASLVAVAAVVWVLARGHQSVRPAPTDDPITISRYVGTPDFLMQGFDEQRAYLFTLRKSVDAIRQAFAARKLDEPQYRMARSGAWMGGKLEHLRAYLKETTPQGRHEYVDKMLAHRQEKKAAATTGPATDAEDTAYFYSPEVKKIVASWSKRRRAEWDEFHKVTHERKQQLAVGGSK